MLRGKVIYAKMAQRRPNVPLCTVCLN